MKGVRTGFREDLLQPTAEDKGLPTLRTEKTWRELTDTKTLQ